MITHDSLVVVVLMGVITLITVINVITLITLGAAAAQSRKAVQRKVQGCARSGGTCTVPL